MSNKIKIELTEKQFLAVYQAIYHDINDMKFEQDEGLPKPELKVLVNAYNAMTEGLAKWEK
tara:strand:+ start:2392 stop:2574 length:183 start_codon:yes stop_codon:yes gene_type:complete